MQKYLFADGPLTIKGAKDADPQKIGEALAAIRAAGDLTPEAVVDSARHEESALHPHFEWDDAAAAERWRHEQARGLIRSIIADNGSNQTPERAFYSIKDKDGVSYRTLEEVRSSGDLQDKLLAAAERDLEAYTVRYRVLKDVCAIVETAKTVVKSKRHKTETRAAA